MATSAAESSMSSVNDVVSTLPKPNISRIKNKQVRADMYRQMKREKKKIKLKEKKDRKKAEDAGGETVPKKVPKTIENMRIPDETMVPMDDEEVLKDEALDEMSSYFNRETTPKILITTCDRPKSRTKYFCRELKRLIPNADYYYRRGLDLKKIIPQCKEKGYTDIIVVNEDQAMPNGMVISHLPDGPTATFKVSNVKLPKEIKKCGDMTSHMPEIILNNFNTRLGHSVGRLLASMFPHDPNFNGRRVITFHNQRDYIFFRQHRYMFKNNKRVGLQELGPRFTMKLRSLQKGTFDSKFGEYEWIQKRHQMETSRRKFFL